MVRAAAVLAAFLAVACAPEPDSRTLSEPAHAESSAPAGDAGYDRWIAERQRRALGPGRYPAEQIDCFLAERVSVASAQSCLGLAEAEARLVAGLALDYEDQVADLLAHPPHLAGHAGAEDSLHTPEQVACYQARKADEAALRECLGATTEEILAAMKFVDDLEASIDAGVKAATGQN